VNTVISRSIAEIAIGFERTLDHISDLEVESIALRENLCRPSSLSLFASLVLDRTALYSSVDVINLLGASFQLKLPRRLARSSVSGSGKDTACSS